MGEAIRRKCVIVIPDDYWTSSLNEIKWICKESDAKAIKRNKKL